MSANPSSAERHAPEDELLAGVELAGRRVGAADEAAAALEPFPVEALEQVLSGPQRDHGKHAGDERHGKCHVRPGAEACELRIGAGAEPGPDEAVAIEDDHPGARKQQKAHGCQPVVGPLEGREAADRLPALALGDLDAAPDGQEQGNEQRDAEDVDSAAVRQLVVMQVTPGAALGLHQHVAHRLRQAGTPFSIGRLVQDVPVGRLVPPPLLRQTLLWGHWAGRGWPQR